MRALLVACICMAILIAGCIGLDDPAQSASSTPFQEAQHMIYRPVQCNENPWQDSSWDHRDDKTAKEARIIKDYYASRDVTLHDIVFQDLGQSVCAACSCPRGDIVHSSVPADDVGRARALGWEFHDHASPTLEPSRPGNLVFL